MHAIDTFEHWGIPVEIHADTDAGDPYENFEQASRLVWCTSVVRREGLRVEETVDDESRDVAVLHRYLTLFDGEAVVLPFHYMDIGSSGYSIYLQKQVDARTSGFVCVSRAKRDEEWPESTTIDGEMFDRQQMAERVARAEFAEWKAWCEGDVYGYSVAAGSPEHESCFGFYGPGDEYVRQEARSMAEYAAFEREKRRLTERMYALDPDANPRALTEEAFRRRSIARYGASAAHDAVFHEWYEETHDGASCPDCREFEVDAEREAVPA